MQPNKGNALIPVFPNFSSEPNYSAAKTFPVRGSLKPVTTPVQSPQSNGMAESLVKTIKRDYASLALRPDARTVLKQLLQWFEHYNTRHPHSALKYMPLRMFRER